MTDQDEAAKPADAPEAGEGGEAAGEGPAKRSGMALVALRVRRRRTAPEEWHVEPENGEAVVLTPGGTRFLPFTGAVFDEGDDAPIEHQAGYVRAISLLDDDSDRGLLTDVAVRRWERWPSMP